jgi:hypothetical protein
MEIIYEDEKHIVRMDETFFGRYSVTRRGGNERIHWADHPYWIRKLEDPKIADVILDHYQMMRDAQYKKEV